VSGGVRASGARGEGDARLFLFDDGAARRWAPFTLTRPAGELLHGCMTLRERAERVFGTRCEGHLTRRALLGFDEPGAAPVVTLQDVGTRGRRILLSSRAGPDLTAVDLPGDATRITVAGVPAGWILPDEAPLPSELWMRDVSAATPSGPALDLPGLMLSSPWDLIAQNAERIRRDASALGTGSDAPAGVIRIGEGALSLGRHAEIEPGVHVDTRQGPVVLAEGARVEGPARLTGPLYVGPRSRILGGTVAASSIGPVCIVRGEVSDSVLLGFVNKSHDGYLGHALVGRWVNLGAFTTNSDLKNNYGFVRVWTPDGDVDTGLLKVGCFLGDHVKTGIGTLLSTGTVIGAGSNVFGNAMPPRVVPPFSWGEGTDLGTHVLDKFIATAERAMARRGQSLTPGVRRVLETAWHETAGQRPSRGTTGDVA
jgi:UDP-N-acetylglucosamine diphosphorylase/glucosamine-1-phosphate N-acetyltransferase